MVVIVTTWCSSLSGAITSMIITDMLSKMHPMSYVNHYASSRAVSACAMTSVPNKRGRRRICFDSPAGVGICRVMYQAAEITLGSQ